jgi:ATP-dependent DNA helicase RecG
VYKKNDNAVGYVRQTDIEKMRYEELVLKLVDEQGYITRANAVELFHLSPPQAYRVLQKLNENGKIKLVGKGKSAKYIKA